MNQPRYTKLSDNSIAFLKGLVAPFGVIWSGIQIVLLSFSRGLILAHHQIINLF